MIRITKQGSHETNADSAIGKAHHYQFANQRLVFQQQVTSLAAFARGSASTAFSQILSQAPPILLSAANAQKQYQGVAQFRGGVKDVICWQQGRFLQIDVSEVAICSIDIAQKHIHLMNDLSFDDQLNLEVVTGPALVMLLAHSGIYCLHAGAVATEYGNIVLIAESGVGKSTLSAHAGSSWCQLADDILPISEHRDRLVLSNFPQLKLPNNTTQETAPEQAAVDLIVRLSAQPTEQISFKALRPIDAMLQIVRHTVAARLFDQGLMQEHAFFARQLSLSTPLVELSYPRDIAKVDEVRSTITGYLRAGQLSSVG